MKMVLMDYEKIIGYVVICLNRPKANNTEIVGYAKIGIKNGSDIANGGGYDTNKTSSRKRYVKWLKVA
ncbi:MAG: hypothetical protein PG981_000325 [Wolbachia endosymbiont of Ctenocephalides orientis wCori]|nr:MAG: hypothetical protein PG981_000325 [Wolbachia endosymbiont of Ctenocephalides orientis wCori]